MSKEKKPEEQKKEPIAPTEDTSLEVVVPEKFKSIVETIEKMSVLDLSELVKILADKFGVSAAAPVVPLSGTAAGTPAAAEEAKEKSEFTIELTAIGNNKIGVIKAVREVTEMGLKAAKDLVESAPAVIKESVKKEQAEEIKKKLEQAGASVSLK